jgi:energy-converting hydrogenase Eha subunit A
MQKTSRVKYYLAASVALLTFLVYLPALRNEFVYWDDNLYIFENPYIRSLDAAFFRWAFLGFHVSNWHPLTWVSHAVDYALWGLNPLGHHLTNILLHAVNTALVVLLALKLFEIVRERSTQNGPASFLNDRTTMIAAGVTGLLFGIHPVHVESVAWVAERKDLLCALFFLMSIMAYVKAVRRMGHGAESERLTLGAMLPALCFFILALLSKPMAVTLPVVLLILDWYPFGRVRSLKTAWSTGVEKLPLVFLSLLSSLLTVLAQRAGSSMVSLKIVPLSIRLPVAVQSLVLYLRKMLLPLNLTPLYAYPKDVSLFSHPYVLALLLVAGITSACAVLARKEKFYLSVWGLYVVMLIPVLGIIQVGNQPLADRYTYLPSIGPFLVAGLGAAWISEKIFRDEKREIFIKGVSVFTGFMLVFCLSYMTVHQIALWRDSVSLWTAVIEKEPEGVPLAYNNRGMVFLKVGQFNKAIPDFDKAIALDPSYAKAYYNRGSAFEQMGDFDKAIADYKRTIALDPLYYEAYYYLDQALKKIGRLNKRTL